MATKWLLIGMTFLLTVLICLTPALGERRDQEAVVEGRPVSAWAGLLKSPDPEQRQEAAAALGKGGPDAKAAVGELIAALKDEDRAVRLQAARSLGQIGPEAKAAVPELRQAIVRTRDGASLREILSAVRKIEGRR